MLLTVRTQFSPGVVLIVEDPQGLSQRVSSLATHLAYASLADITFRISELASPDGLEASKLRKEYLETIEKLPEDITKAAALYLKEYTDIEIHSEFVSPSEIQISVTPRENGQHLSTLVH